MSRNKDDRRPPKATPRSLKEVSPAVKERVRKHALSQLSPKDRKTTNLYFNRYEYERGARIGPRFAPVELKQATVLVFADDDPKANFEHECRYILYDAEGNWLKDVEASFPPSPLLPGGTLDVLHIGV